MIGKVDEVGEFGFRSLVLEEAEAGIILVLGVCGWECTDVGVLMPD